MAITNEQDEARPTGTLGVERWVQFSYFFGAIVTAWFLIRVSTSIWTILADTIDSVPLPNDNVVTLLAGATAFVGAILAYRSKSIHTFVTEVCVECSRVTWPSRDETRSQTVVVVIVSVVAAVILGVFDYAWSTLSNLIYNG